MKWFTVEENYCLLSEMGHKAVKDQHFPCGFEWHLFMPDRPALQLRRPDAVFQNLKDLKEYVRCKS